jgi:hypothetical protein
LDSRHRRNVWLVTSVTARVLAYQGNSREACALGFAHPVSGFHAVNLRLNWQVAGAHRDREWGCALRPSWPSGASSATFGTIGYLFIIYLAEARSPALATAAS